MDLVARVSLAILWVFTGITSEFFAKDIGFEVLSAAGISGQFASVLISLGSFADVLVGFWVLFGVKLGLCYLVQMVLIVCYSILLSFIGPDFWLHPFGPITKNIPILVFIYYLYREQTIKTNQA
jgi:hypothetical protein